MTLKITQDVFSRYAEEILTKSREILNFSQYYTGRSYLLQQLPLVPLFVSIIIHMI